MGRWKHIQLGDIIHIKHGYGFKGEHFTEKPNNNYLLTPGNFAIGGGFKSDKMKFYDGPIKNDFVLKAGDVIVTMTDLSKQADTLGYSAKVPNDPNNNYLHNQRLGLVSLKTNEFDLEYIYWLLRTDDYQRYVAGSSSGATVKHTSPAKIYSSKLLVPESKITQSKIASILNTYDDLIQNNINAIKLLDEKAKLTYDEWFIRKKFPGHEYTSMDSETGLPHGWKTMSLNEVADINSKGIKKGFEEIIEYIDIASVSPGRVDYTTNYAYSEAPGRAKRIVQHGDIIWSCVRPNRRSHAVIWKPVKNLIASTGFCVISPKTLPTSYLLQYLTTEEFVGYLTNRAGGVAYPAVKAIDFKEALVIIPDENVVRKYDTIFSNCLQLTWNLSRQNQILKEARDILLPRLMSGIIDVDKLNINIPETV